MGINIRQALLVVVVVNDGAVGACR